MRLEQFEYLVAAADCQSMSAAANVLHVTSQCISKAIKQLEDELGAPLFTRSKYGVTLTADGEAVYTQGKVIMQAVNILRHSYALHAYAADSVSGPLHLLSSAALSKTVLDTIKNLSNAYADLTPAIFIKEALEINQYLLPYHSELDDYDFILTSMGSKTLPSCQLLSERYHIYFLREDRLGVQMNSDAPLAQLDKVPLKALATLPLVAYVTSPAVPSKLFQLTEDFGVRLTPTFISNSPQSCANYVKNNNAYGLVTLSLLNESSDMPSDLLILPLKERLYLNHLMFVKKSTPLPPRTQAFCQLLLKSFPTYRKLY